MRCSHNEEVSPNPRTPLGSLNLEFLQFSHRWGSYFRALGRRFEAEFWVKNKKSPKQEPGRKETLNVARLLTREQISWQSLQSSLKL